MPVLPSTEVSKRSGATGSTLRGGGPNPRSTTTVDFPTLQLNSMARTTLLAEASMHSCGQRRGGRDGAAYGSGSRQPGTRTDDLPEIWEGRSGGLWALPAAASSAWPPYTTDLKSRCSRYEHISGPGPKVTSPGSPPLRLIGGAGPRHPDDARGPRTEGLRRQTPGEAAFFQALAAARSRARNARSPRIPPNSLGPINARERNFGQATESGPVSLGGAGPGAGAGRAPKFPLAWQGEMLGNF